MSAQKKRLFVLRDGPRGKIVRDEHGEMLCFSDKMAAKRARDTIPGAVVSAGPDHWKFEGGAK